MTKNIVVFCAHSDDQIFGAGGTLAKFAKEGYKIYIVVFSYGESSHFWLKPEFSIDTRVSESREVGKLLGFEDTVFLGLKEGRFMKDAGKKNIPGIIEKILSKRNPVFVFTHSSDDPHVDHRSVHTLVERACRKQGITNIYMFDIWTIFNKKLSMPSIRIDVTGTFNLKLEALKCFRSQTLTMISLLWSVYTKAIFNGLANRTKYAERFWIK